MWSSCRLGFLIALVITWRQVFVSVANRKKYPNVVDAVVPYVSEHRTNTQVVLVVHRRAFSLLAFAFRLLVGWNYEGGARVLFAPLTHLVGGQQIEGDNEQQASKLLYNYNTCTCLYCSTFKPTVLQIQDTFIHTQYTIRDANPVIILDSIHVLEGLHERNSSQTLRIKYGRRCSNPRCRPQKLSRTAHTRSICTCTCTSTVNIIFHQTPPNEQIHKTCSQCISLSKCKCGRYRLGAPPAHCTIHGKSQQQVHQNEQESTIVVLGSFLIRCKE